MVLKVLFCLCLVVELFCVPWYLKALWPEKCKKSLILKMICSTMFVSICVLSMFIADNFSRYAITMLVGFVFGWIGDYFLHAKPSNAYFVTGFISFLIGHIIYIVAFVKATPVIAPDYKLFNGVEIAVIIGIVTFLMVAGELIKIKYSPLIVKIGVIIYLLAINSMLVRASVLGYSYYKTGAEFGIVALLLLSIGATAFLLSDSTLGIIVFGGRKKNYPLKIFNIVTYFWGQIMLASSVLFINA
ncbi:MAG: lysoplasmalogenase [Acutalibacteraceae bacterium]